MVSEDMDSMEVWEVGIAGQEHRCILGAWEKPRHILHHSLLGTVAELPA